MFSNVESRTQIPYGPNEQNLRGKRVVIIGDETGVGQATAVMLVKRGAPVFFAARSAEELRLALTAINQVDGDGDGMVADLKSPEGCRRFFMLAQAWLGRIDALIHPLAGGESANLCAEEAIRRMRARRAGHIININLAADRPGGLPAQRVTPELRREASELGIRVTLIELGEVGAATRQREAVLRNEVLRDEVPPPLNAAGRASSPLAPLNAADREPVASQEDLSVKDLARCVVNSLAQPFGAEIVVLPGRWPAD